MNDSISFPVIGAVYCAVRASFWLIIVLKNNQLFPPAYCAVQQVSNNNSYTTIHHLQDCAYSARKTLDDLLCMILADAYSNDQIITVSEKNTLSASLHKCSLFLDSAGSILTVSNSSHTVIFYITPPSAHQFVHMVLTEKQLLLPPFMACPDPEPRRQCITSFLMGARNTIWLLPEKYNENNNKLNAVYLTFNKVVDRFSA